MFVLISCAVITSIMSTVAVCLKDTMWTLDIHTHTHTHCDIYGYIFFFVSGSEFVTTSLIIASALPLLLGICSFSCLRREPDYRCPQNQDSYYGRRFNCSVCTLGWGCVLGGGYQLAGCAHLVFLSLTFGPQQVFGKLPTPTTSNVGAWVTATLLYFFSLFTHHHHLPVHFKVLQTHTNLLSIVHRYCSFFYFCYFFCFLFFCYADEIKKIYIPISAEVMPFQ